MMINPDRAFRAHRKPPVAITPYHVEVIRLRSQTDLQGDIASYLGIAVSTVAKVQRRYGFPHFTRHEGRVRSRELAAVS